MRASFALRLVVLGALSLAPLQALAAGADPLTASKIQREQAGARFTRGHQLYDRKDYEGALSEFRASLDIVASPNARLFVARSLRELGRLVEAYVEFGRTAVEGKELAREDSRYAKAADSATAERADLEPKLAFVTVTVDHAAPEATLKVAGEEIRRAAWGEQAPLMPGDAEIVVETSGRAPVSKRVTLTAGQHLAVAIDAAAGDSTTPEPPPSPPPDETEASNASRARLRPFAYAAGGVGAVGLVVFAIEGANASSTYDNLKNNCRVPCPSMADQISSGKTAQTIANVSLAVGLVGIAAGVTLFVFSLPHKKEARREPAPTTSLVFSPGFVGVRGTL